VRHSDRLQALTEALHSVEDGVMLFDSELKLEFINARARQLWSLPDNAVGTALLDVVAQTHLVFDAPADQIDSLVKRRIASIRDGDPAPYDIRTIHGKIIRAHCTKLPNGGRILTYCDVTDLIRNTERLELLATVDSMTGTFNRRHFLAVAEAEWNRFQRYHRPLSFIMLDIDHFKSVNDRYGHATGDQVICAVAKACTDGQRASDVVGRLGGEEFGILLPETDDAAARLVAERIRERIAAELFAYERVNFRITASIGIAPATLAMSGVASLMRSADMALYEAKAQGRNRCVMFHQPPSAGLSAAE
jgi:diguanylate cyclase (GGDEF)-like protein